MGERKKLSDQDLLDSIDIIMQMAIFRYEQKGPGIYVSSHETLGIVTEEFYELVDAVKNNQLGNVRRELLDIAVGCVFGIASIDSGEMDW